MGSIPIAVLMLVASNVFMTFAWYGHLKHRHELSWLAAALVSWGIALFEYLLHVPANRIGSERLSLAQLKITQEVITLAVFMPFAVYWMRERPRLDFLWAGLCLLAAVFFVFRGGVAVERAGGAGVEKPTIAFPADRPSDYRRSA